MALTPRIAGTTGGIDAEGHINLTILYEVQATTDITSTTDVWSVLQAVYLEAPATYTVGSSTATNAFCHGIGPANLRQDDDRQIWTVPVAYSTKPIGNANGDGGGGGGGSSARSPYTSPLAEPWKISGSYVRGEATTIIDKDNALITLAGTEEIKSVMIPSGYDTLHMEGHTAYMSLPVRAQAIFKCNSATIWGLTPRQLLLVSWAYDVRRFAGGACIYHVLDWEINYAGWNEYFRNASYMKINPDYVAATDPIEKRLLPILAADGTPVTEPHPIDEDGNPCAAADAPLNTAMAIEEFNFLSLGFPLVLPGPFI